MRTIGLIYFNAGGGHRTAAQALQAVLRLQQRPWSVRCVNLVDMLDPQEKFRRLFGMPPEDIYNWQLAKGWTLGLSFELKLLQGLIRLGHGSLVHRLQRHWQQARPDMVVSLVPNFNRALGLGLAKALPGVPFVTVLTDLADHPPHFWIEPGATAGGAGAAGAAGAARRLSRERALHRQPRAVHGARDPGSHPGYDPADGCAGRAAGPIPHGASGHAKRNRARTGHALSPVDDFQAAVGVVRRKPWRLDEGRKGSRFTKRNAACRG